MILATAAVLLALQQDVTIFRTEKTEYSTALNRCKDAEGMIATDPQGAITRLDEIIANPRLRKIECRVRIEERPSEYTDWYLFLPYQYRSRARLLLAKKAEPEAALKLVGGAVDDLQESVKRGVASSEAPLKAARAELEKVKAAVASTAPKEDPVLKIREGWDPLLRENRFKSAREFVEKEGKALSEDQRKPLLLVTDQRCREFLVSQVAAFRARFIAAMAQGLERMTAEEFDLHFSLPAPEELTASHPAVDWARKHLPAFRAVHAGKAPVHSLGDAAIEAAPLEERVENQWFRAIEHPVFQSLRAGVSAEVDKSRDAPGAEREKRRAQADALLGQWKAFVQKLEARFLERHAFVAEHEAQLKKLLEGFPVDAAELDRIELDLDASFGADAPDAELARIEQALAGCESRPNLSRESRQRMWTARVIAAALRGFLAGKTEEALIRELEAYGQKLRDVGAANDAKKYGTRVAKVLAGLR